MDDFGAAFVNPEPLMAGDVEYRVGKVLSVQAGPPLTVTISMGKTNGLSGAGIAGVRYPKWYTPAVGDTVQLMKVGGSLQVFSVLA